LIAYTTPITNVVSHAKHYRMSRPRRTEHAHYAYHVTGRKIIIIAASREISDKLRYFVASLRK